MSVSIALLPVALALRVFMGKDRFEEWVNSMQVKIPSSFNNEEDLLLTVRKAGYDADMWGGLYKTHIRGKELWFFWEKIDGVWTAVFGQADSKDEIKRFIKDIEAKAGRKIFEWDELAQNPLTLPVRTFPTNFRDSELLHKTLLEYSLNPVFNDQGQLLCEINEMVLVFSQEHHQHFNLEVRNVTDMRQLYSNLDNINDCYNRNVQSQTYKRLKSNIEEHGLTVESEDVYDDNSIVITLSIEN